MKSRFVHPAAIRLLRQTALVAGGFVLAPGLAFAQAGAAFAEDAETIGEKDDERARANRQTAAPDSPEPSVQAAERRRTGPSEEIVVTGARDRGYAAGEASTATKLPMAILDTPLSVQVVNRALIDDLNAVRTSEIVQYVSGIYQGTSAQVGGDQFVIRGFEASDFLRDGYVDRTRTIRETANVERLEVLKGPASVLYGRVQPGGTLNYVTKRPLAEPMIEVTGRIDSFGLGRVTADASVMNHAGTLGLRVNAAGENGGNFRDFTFSDRAFGSAALLWRPGANTEIVGNIEYLYDSRSVDRTGLPLLRGRAAPVPIERVVTEPTDFRDTTQFIAGYIVDHHLSADWRVRHALRYTKSTAFSERTQVPTSSVVPDEVTTYNPVTGLIERNFRSEKIDPSELTTQFEVIGHTNFGGGFTQDLLVGLEYDTYRNTRDETTGQLGLAANQLNIFDPVYRPLDRGNARRSTLSDEQLKTWAVYSQTMVTLGTRWNILLGARYDEARNRTVNFLNNRRAGINQNQVSPRAGIVFHPTPNTSLYGSYSQSFVPVIGQTFAGDPFDPQLGKQYEVGAKGEWFGGRLGSTLALFQVKRTNVSTSDPVNEGFNIQTGEITSEGVEFDVNGSPTSGLSISANLAYTDARVTADTNPALIGRPSTENNIPKWGGAIWASYEVQRAALRGLGAGLGLSYVGDRTNSNGGRFAHTLPAFARVDLNVWYQRANWRLSAKIENVLDERYLSSGSNLGVRPGAPRNILAQASYRW